MNRTQRLLLLTSAAMIAAGPHLSAQTSWGIAALRTGDIFFCDQVRDHVWRLEPDGKLVVALDDTHCRAVVTGPDGLAYGEYVGASVPAHAELGIWRMAPDLRHDWLEAPSLTPDASIWLAADANGDQFSWNGAAIGSDLSQIVRRDRSGVSRVVAGSGWGAQDGAHGAARFGHVAGIAVAPDHSLIVADSGNVRRVDQLGNVRTEAMGILSGTTGGAATREGLWDYAMGVASDLDGSAIVVDAAARHIVRVSREGRTVELWRARWGWHPAGVAMLGSTCYVLESWPMPAIVADLVGNPRLLQLKPDGSVTTVATVSSWIVRAAVALLVIAFGSWFWTARRPRMSHALPLPPEAIGR